MDAELIKVLVEFFEDSFREDPMGVGDWLVQGGQDPDEFVSSVEQLKNSLRGE